MLSNIYAKIVEAKNPIPLDLKEIDNITDDLARWIAGKMATACLKSKFDNEDVIAEFTRRVYHEPSPTFYISNSLYKGHAPVNFYLNVIRTYKTKDKAHRAFWGASYAQKKRGAPVTERRRITININGDFLPTALTWYHSITRGRDGSGDENFINSLQSVLKPELGHILVHEITHLVDNIIGGFGLGDDYKDPDVSGKVDYLVQPIEMKAWGRNFYMYAKDVAIKALNEMPGAFRNEHDLARHVWQEVGSSNPVRSKNMQGIEAFINTIRSDKEAMKWATSLFESAVNDAWEAYQYAQ